MVHDEFIADHIRQTFQELNIAYTEKKYSAVSVLWSMKKCAAPFILTKRKKQTSSWQELGKQLLKQP